MTRAGALIAGGVLMLSGCAAAGPALPDGIDVVLYETRFDAALHQLQIRVTNDSDADLTLTAAALETTLFEGVARFDRGQVVPSGSTRNLPVVLGAVRCDAATSQASVLLDFTADDGRGSSVEVPLVDLERLDQAHERECLVEAVERHALILPPAHLDWMPGSDAAGVLEFTIEPTGALGTLTLVAADNTTLLGLVDEAGGRVTPAPLGIVVDGTSSPSVLPLRIAPARCDAHAIAEDKQGTHIPFDVELSDGRSGRIRIPVGDVVTAEIYAFVTDRCTDDTP